MSEIIVGVSDLKARLSEYLRQVKQGHTVIVTNRGRPVTMASFDRQLIEAASSIKMEFLPRINGGV